MMRILNRHLAPNFRPLWSEAHSDDAAFFINYMSRYIYICYQACPSRWILIADSWSLSGCIILAVTVVRDCVSGRGKSYFRYVYWSGDIDVYVYLPFHASLITPGIGQRLGRVLSPTDLYFRGNKVSTYPHSVPQCVTMSGRPQDSVVSTIAVEQQNYEVYLYPIERINETKRIC